MRPRQVPKLLYNSFVHHRTLMTQQQLLQNAREVLVNAGTDSQRKLLQSYAVQQGRTIAQIKKASTFRLAMWSRGLKSAI